MNPEWILSGKEPMLKKDIVIDINNTNSTAENSILGNNITGKKVKVWISNNDISKIIELHRELTVSLRNSQNQVNTLLEILKQQK